MVAFAESVSSTWTDVASSVLRIERWWTGFVAVVRGREYCCILVADDGMECAGAKREALPLTL